MFGYRNESLIIAISGSGSRTVHQSPHLELSQLLLLLELNLYTLYQQYIQKFIKLIFKLVIVSRKIYMLGGSVSCTI